MTAEPQARIETLSPVSDRTSNAPSVSSIPGKDSTWWVRYCQAIDGLPKTTKEVLSADAAYIAEKAVPQTNGLLDEGAFGVNRVRTGIVVGSVQSGKTASMLAVAAMLLDKGVDILVVLAGTRVSLWLQTYERLLEQLDGSDLYSAWIRDPVRALVPQPEDVLASSDRVDPSKYLLGARSKVRMALATRKPVIFVVPKEDDHLLALGRFISAHIPAPGATNSNAALTMVVLDDEADDASVLDSTDGGKITPKFIQQLWSSDKDQPATRQARLFATYIAYTATPQANYLQVAHNPLAPRDFHAALRVPADRGQKSPRSATYAEASGLKAYYTGGDFYYDRFLGLPADPCIAFQFPAPATSSADETSLVEGTFETVRVQMIGEAIRSYLVAGAARLFLSGRTFPEAGLAAATREELTAVLPPTHSMLYHPSALKDEQFSGAAEIIHWSSGVLPSEQQSEEIDWSAELCLDCVGLTKRLTIEEDLWKKWLDSFKRSAMALGTFPGNASEGIQDLTWSAVKSALQNWIFPRVRVRVLNSDPRASDRPEFFPQRTPDGLFVAPKDLLTIFVAGNVLSRGLTIEGLSTSLFLRGAKEPAADTQMQMQRWFGYRGNHFAFCRVFAFSDQLALFRQYHSNDLAMKSEILAHMENTNAPFSHGALVLQGEAFKATSKVESRRVPLHPGPTPSIRLFEPPDGLAYADNLRLLHELLQDPEWDLLEYPNGSQRGLINKRPMGMLEVASILERLRYSSHDPDLRIELSKRWESLQKLLNWPERFFRPPDIQPRPMLIDPSSCPYSIAAYFRLWNAALARADTPGLIPTDNPTTPWNRINISAYRTTTPLFYVGVRFGSGPRTKSLTFKGQPFPMMQRGLAQGRNDLLATLWGSRNPSEQWFGDQMFDYHFHNTSGVPRLLSEGAWRPRGHPGLLLFHVVADPATGSETIALGLAIPHGGPDHVAALKAERNV